MLRIAMPQAEPGRRHCPFIYSHRVVERCFRKEGNALSLNKNIITLIASMFLVSSGYTMVIPFLPLYLEEMGVPEREISLWTGLVFSSCFLVAAVMGPVWGKLADVGGKKKMAIPAVLLGFSYLCCGLCQNQYQLMAARAFQGFANGFVAAAMAIISDSADSRKLGGTLGMAQTSLVVGGICGPLMGGALSHVAGMKNTFYLSALFLWIVAGAVIFFVREKKGTKTEKPVEKTSITADLKYAFGNDHVRGLLLITFFLQTTLLMIQPVTSLYVSQLMNHSGNIELVSGIIMSSGGVAGALTTTLWGKLGQSKGYYKAITVTLSLAGCITILQSLPDSVIGFGLCQFLAGCFVIGANPSINAALVKFTPSDFRGRVFGLSNTAQQFGNMWGPLLSSAISMTFGLWEVYAAAGLIQLALGIIVYANRVRHKENG